MPQDEEFRKSTHSKTKPKTYQRKSKEAESLKRKHTHSHVIISELLNFISSDVGFSNWE